MKTAHKSAQITLADLAQKLQVSKVTISKALRDHPDISLGTKQRVRTLAAKLGYTPNYLARNLSSQKSGTIGLVVPKITHHFFATAIETIYDLALENNYEVILMVSQENAQREALHIQTLLSMRVDGLLISVSEQTKDRTIFQHLEKLGLPTILFDRILEGLNFHTVTSDDEGGAFQMVERVIGSGYKQIAHLAGYSHTSIGRLRKQGYEKALKKHGIPYNPAQVLEAGFSEKDGYNSFLKLHEKGNLPEIIFTVTFPVALGALNAAREVGLSIPDDIDMVCFGGSIYNSYLKPALTYVAQPVEELGRKAFSLLLSEIQHPESSGTKQVVLPTRIVQCETCIDHSN